jgi:hypothetical protein
VKQQADASIEQVFDDPDLAAEGKKGLHFTPLSESLPHFAICYRCMCRAGKKKARRTLAKELEMSQTPCYQAGTSATFNSGTIQSTFPQNSTSVIVKPVFPAIANGIM